MIFDLDRFLAEARPRWDRLEALVARLENDPGARLGLDQVRELHHLYQCATADLVRLESFAAEIDLRRYLEALVVRAYGEIHDNRDRAAVRAPLRRLFVAFPRAFRRRRRAFAMALAATLIGCLFGAGALALDPQSKPVLLPFPQLQGNPAVRVARAESSVDNPVDGHKVSFSGYLMTHNARVAILSLAFGIAFGIGTVILLFYNGVILGAVALDYLRAGQGTFLCGWLLPHGVIEIPAFLIAGQAGLTIAGALLGNRALPLGRRLRRVWGDVAALVGGAAVMLIWAGLVESFLSQDHQPVLPYGFKIAFGLIELLALGYFLGRSGRAPEKVP